jgi:hypothetical protein
MEDTTLFPAHLVFKVGFLKTLIKSLYCFHGQFTGKIKTVC